MAFNTALFSRLPTNKRPHDRYHRPFEHAGSMFHGDIVPVYCKLVSPGEIIDETVYGNIRMSTPIAPLYSSNRCAFNAFYVPIRLLWEHWPQFMGDPGEGIEPVEPGTFQIPQSYINDDDPPYQIKVHSVAHYLRKPLYKRDDNNAADSTSVSVLKERAYYLICSEWYRHEQIQAPFVIAKDDTDSIVTIKGQTLKIGECMPIKCLKNFDYFTTCTKGPLFGDEVLLPLGSKAPIVAEKNGEVHSTGGNVVFRSSFYPNSGGILHTFNDQDNPSSSSIWFQGVADSSIPSDGRKINSTNLMADLSQATAATIDQLYLAMAAQAWYHNSNFGARYFEMNEIHYGVSNPDLVLQRPERIGSKTVDIVVQQVLSTAGAEGDESTKLGQPGANSSTNFKFHIYNKATGEWGFIMILANTYHEHYYSAGVLREDSYLDMFDFFFPEFANIGDQAVLTKELYASNKVSGVNDSVFGYQEAWAEMRYTPNQLSGILDPYAEAGLNGSFNALRYWVLAEKWSEAPVLSEEFICENRDAITQALVTGETGPDYIFDLYFAEKTASLVPTRSIPGVPSRGNGLV